MKISPKITIPPVETFKNFRNRVSYNIKENKQINLKSFACDLNDICNIFEAKHQRKDLNRVSSRFAESLVNLGQPSLAGIVYSTLIKLNEGNIKLIEELATKALAIAKRQHDPIHIMARANDLKRVYKIIAPGSEQHLKALYTTKRALVDICINYKETKRKYKSVTAKMKPLEQYEIMLASIRTEIAKVIKTKEPKTAKLELLSARESFQKLELEDKVQEVDKILKGLKV